MQLALKHRAEKRLRQRVMMFVGSPVDTSAAELTKTAKALKKNGVAVDIINFGEAEANNEKLEAFIEAVNKDGNSRLCAVPNGCILADALRSSELMVDPESAAESIGNSGDSGATGSGDGGTDDMGIDASLQQTDPELYLALRESWEAARQTAETTEPAVASGEEATAAASAEATTDTASLTAAVTDDVMDEDEELRRAIEMSMAAAAGGAEAEQDHGDDSMTVEEGEQDFDDDDDGDDDIDEDAAMARALAMSMEGAGRADDSAAAEGEDLDPAFLQSVLQNLDPGNVDPSEVMRQQQADKDDKES
eukprot:COSAG05_NODE_391_length_10419_cov_8.156686_6_plen_307_part_00